MLVALAESDLRTLLQGPSMAWNFIDGMITSRRNRFGSNAAAEFEVGISGCVYFELESFVSQKVVCPAVAALPEAPLDGLGDGRPVSSVVPEAFQEWLRHCESGQLTCILRGGRQRYKSTSFGAAAFVIAQV